jgi:hypothetical protein
MLEMALPRRVNLWHAPDSARGGEESVASCISTVSKARRPGGERREEEADLEAANLQDLETAAEKATVAASQTQADFFQLHCHTVQLILISQS